MPLSSTSVISNPEKQTAMLGYGHLQKIMNCFRILEFCLILVLLSWTSSRVPFILKISTEYFQKFITIIISPVYIFLISNVIVLTLLAKSDKLTASKKSDIDIFEEFAKNIENSVSFSELRNVLNLLEKEVVYQDKRSIRETNTGTCNLIFEGTLVAEHKVVRRSQSENLNAEISGKACGKLRRSETEISRESQRSNTTLAECVEELNNEEFQRTIEAFIEKQLRFRKEEKFAIVPRI